MSGYPLPSVSTLSAALGSDNIQIAPELMGAEGMPMPAQQQQTESQQPPDQPQTHKRTASEMDDNQQQQQPSGSGNYGGGFQSSAARDEGNREWAGYSGNSSRNMHPWEEGYRDENLAAVMEPPAPVQESKPRKKPRGSKSKNKDKESSENTLEEGYEYDFEDSSQDPKAGVVFRHPVPGAPQACVRCHRIKRKCDNARPRCAGCSKADVACVFELSPATSSHISHLKSDNLVLTTQIASAHNRISHLESVVSALEKGLPRPASPVQSAGEIDPTRTDFAALARTVLSVRSSTLPTAVGTVSMGQSHFPRQGISADASQRGSASLPPYDVARSAAETFFMSNAISYPFIDKHEFLRDMDALYDASRRSEEWSTEEIQRGKEFVFFMVVAIGTTHQERVGDAERGASKEFRHRALGGLPYAVAREDLLCVQALLLLGIYSMFDPSDMSLWHIVGFAARIAIALNLHRKVDDSSMSAEMIEQRRRVFYGLYNLERVVATTLSRPLVITDDDIDVELPSPLPADPPYRGVPRMLFTQQIIKLRRLQGQILSTAYSVSGSQNALPERERADIITDFHSRLDTWLAESPVPPSEEEEKPGMINNHSWFLLNYHHCLCLLYRPSPLYPVSTTQRLSALFDASSRCVDLWLELWHEQKIAYSIINVSAQFLDCISLLYCLCEYDNRSSLHSDEKWRLEVSTRVGQCHELLEAFGRALPETAKYKEIFSKLSEMLLARHGPLSSSSGAQTLPSTVAPTPSSSGPQQNTASSNNATGSFSTIDLHNIPLLSPTQPTQTGNQNGNKATTSEEQVAWNAMTQLWHNAGDFNFDESIFGQIHDERLLGLDLSNIKAEGGAGASGGQTQGNGGHVGIVNGQGQVNPVDAAALQPSNWGGEMLWNQLG